MLRCRLPRQVRVPTERLELLLILLLNFASESSYLLRVHMHGASRHLRVGRFATRLGALRNREICGAWQAARSQAWSAAWSPVGGRSLVEFRACVCEWIRCAHPTAVSRTGPRPRILYRRQGGPPPPFSHRHPTQPPAAAASAPAAAPARVGVVPKAPRVSRALLPPAF